jgi:hypothetical protein
MRNAKPSGKPNPNQAHLFMRMNGIVSFRHDAAEDREYHQGVESQLGERRPDADAAHERWPQAAKDAQAWKLDVTADGIRDEIDVMAELAQRLDAVIFAERRAARLEERLRREHQDAHTAL